MSDFALQFIPGGDGGQAGGPPVTDSFASKFLPPMSMQERIEAAKAGTLPMRPGSAERQAEIDAGALERMGPQTNMLEQFGTGASEGLAGLAGTPVDLMTAALNAGGAGINKLAGTNIPPIQPLPATSIKVSIGLPKVVL